MTSIPRRYLSSAKTLCQTCRSIYSLPRTYATSTVTTVEAGDLLAGLNHRKSGAGDIGTGNSKGSVKVRAKRSPKRGPDSALQEPPRPPQTISPEWEEEIRERARRKTLLEMFTPLGSTQHRENTWQAHHSLNRPISPAQVTISALMASGAHLGHSRARTRSAFLPYIYGRRAGISIIDLDQTLPLFRRAANFIRAVAHADGSILFVGTHVEGVQRAARKAAERVGKNGFHVSDKWLPGTLTNSVSLLGAEVRDTHAIPDVAVFLNPLKNMHAIRECNVALVPTIGIVDSDADPRIVTYAIPANDESLRTIELVAGVLSVAAREGVQSRTKNKPEGRRRRDPDPLD